MLLLLSLSHVNEVIRERHQNSSSQAWWQSGVREVAATSVLLEVLIASVKRRSVITGVLLDVLSSPAAERGAGKQAIPVWWKSWMESACIR